MLRLRSLSQSRFRLHGCQPLSNAAGLGKHAVNIQTSVTVFVEGITFVFVPVQRGRRFGVLAARGTARAGSVRHVVLCGEQRSARALDLRQNKPPVLHRCGLAFV